MFHRGTVYVNLAPVGESRDQEYVGGSSENYRESQDGLAISQVCVVRIRGFALIAVRNDVSQPDRKIRVLVIYKIHIAMKVKPDFVTR